jgi:hypothetical protein
MLSLFIPANTSFGLALLLVPIEFVSYIFKPIYFLYFKNIEREKFFTSLLVIIGTLVMGDVLDRTHFVECSSPPAILPRLLEPEIASGGVVPNLVVEIPAQGGAELAQGGVAPQVNGAPQGAGEVQSTLKDSTNIQRIFFRVAQTNPNFS